MRVPSQAFRLSRTSALGLTGDSASVLSWSLSPSLSRPGLVNASRVLAAIAQVKTAAANLSGSYERLLRAASPNCTEFILECNLAGRAMSAVECCASVFKSEPVITQFGKRRTLVSVE
jgi:hypothetical protein